MIDLHSHIIPNVDDGAPSLDVALAMLDDYVSKGVSTVVATPHWAYPTAEEHQARIHSAYRDLVVHADARNVTLLLGRECMLPPDYTALLDDTRLSLNEGRFILVELPFSNRPLFMEESIFGLQSAGKIVILAHPERYRFIQQDPLAAKALNDRGVLFQINLGSVTGTFGKAAMKTAEYLLLQGLVHLAATDAHSNGGRMQAITAGLAVLRDTVGEDGCDRLVRDNPGLVLADIIPEPVRPQALPVSLLNRWFGRFLF